jgi:hypothetical protein
MRRVAGSTEDGGGEVAELDDTRGPTMSQGEVHDAPDGWRGAGKTGLNDSDVVALVRLVKGGRSFEQAKRALGGGFAPGVVDGWKAEVLRRAGRTGPVMPDKPAPRPPAPPKREVRDVNGELDIALAALIAGRGDLAIRMLRDLGADATRAPEDWIDILQERNARAGARRAAAAAAPSEEDETPAKAAAPPARPARRAAAPKAKGRAGRKPKAAVEAQEGSPA